MHQFQLLKLVVSFYLFVTILGCTYTSTSERYLGQEQKQFQQQLTSINDFRTAWQRMPYFKLDRNDLFQITDKQQTQFLAFYNAPQNARLLPSQRVKLFTDQFLSEFVPSNHNNTASEAFYSKSGNCMSLAALTAALANIVDVDFEFQILNRTPVYYRNDKHLMVQNHIRTKLKADNLDWNGVVDFVHVNERQQAASISKTEFASLFYRNLAALQLIENDLNLAYQLSANAMEYAPYSAENINLHAIILGKTIGDDAAIDLFNSGLKYTKPTNNYLQNFIQILKRNGYVYQALNLTLRLENKQKQEPYYWLQAGDRLLASNELHRSLEKYKKAETLAPYLDEVYIGKARAYYQLGLFREAKASLRKAQKAAIKVHSNEFYEAKMAHFGIRRY